MTSRTCRSFLSVLLVWGTTNLSAYPQEQELGTPGLPDTPAGRQAAELLALVRDGSEDQLEAFVRGNFSAPMLEAFSVQEHVDILTGVRQENGPVELRAVPVASEHRIEALLFGPATEDWLRLIVQVEASAPHTIAGLGLQGADPPAGQGPPAPADDAELAAAVGRYVEMLVSRDQFSGTVLLARDGSPFFTAAHGLASKRFGVPVTLDTKFNLGSMNKMFTAVCVLQLAQENLLFLDDPIGEYLDADWLPLRALETIEVRHLLCHTSGLGSYFNNDYMRSSKNLYRAVNDYKPLVTGDRPRFTPGSSWAYSNTGFLLAGAVLEGAAGEDYFEFVRANLYEPAGMVNSDCYEMDQPVPNLAMGYSRDDTLETGWRNNLYQHVLKGGPAGGGFSTVEDLLAFDVALRDGSLLEPEMLEQLWTPKPELGSPDYGFGFMVREGPRGRVVGHGGGFSGINSELRMFLDCGYTVAVMSNYDGAASRVLRRAEALIESMD